MTEISNKYAIALTWWNNLNAKHQQDIERILQLDMDYSVSPPIPKTLELIRAYRQCPNKDYKDVR